MAYNANVPQGTDRISDTQQPILDNFIAIQTLIGVNHENFASVLGEGKHKFLQMPAQVPTIPTSATEVGLYAKNDPTTGSPALFFQKSNLAADSGLSFTEYENTLPGAPTTTQAASGWTRLPSGILVKWGSDGTFSVTTTVTRTVDAATPGPNFTQRLWNVLVFGTSSPTDLFNYSLNTFAPGGSNTQFVVRVTRGGAAATSNARFNWLCWGI